MISHGKDIKIFTGNANPKLAADICKIIGTKLGESEVKSFADGEASVSLYETVRGSDVFLIQSTCKPVNDNLMELLVMIDACRRASAGRITAVMPYFGYARQDRKAGPAFFFLGWRGFSGAAGAASGSGVTSSNSSFFAPSCTSSASCA